MRGSKILCIFVALLLLCGCNISLNGTNKTTDASSEETILEVGQVTSNITEVTPEYAEQQYTIAEIMDCIKPVGRVFLDGDGLICDHTASGMELNAYVKGELSIGVRCDRTTYYTVFLDGERFPERIRVPGGNQRREITVPVSEELELHHIQILKQTEAQHSLSVIESLAFYGVIASRPQDASYYVEFIGDSITCGAGNLWDSSSKIPSAASTNDGTYEDGTDAYAFLTAEAMGADASIISCSGIGIDQCWLPFNIASYYPAQSYYRSQDVHYEFSSARTPDLVVINLGTNDEMRDSTETAYKKGVKDLIAFIRSSYSSQMPIVWVCGMMSEGESAWTIAAIEELGGENEDLYVLRIARDNAGGNSHPSATAHRSAAKRLSRYIMSQDFYTIPSIEN